MDLWLDTARNILIEQKLQQGRSIGSRKNDRDIISVGCRSINTVAEAICRRSSGRLRIQGGRRRVSNKRLQCGMVQLLGTL